MLCMAAQVMADVVQRYAAMGHTWMKFHLCQFENVIDQVKAIDAVAPEGFKIHFGERPLAGRQRSAAASAS